MSKRTLCALAIGLGLTNYLLFAGLTLFVGGDVLHGHVTQGHYFVAAGDGFVEVTRALFEFGRWHAYSLLLTIPLLLWGGFHLSPVSHDPDELVFMQGD